MRWLVISLLLLAGCSNHKQVGKNLQLIKAYEVITHGSIEPSGLTEWNGEFYTVSDKDNFIYRLQFGHDSIILEPFLEIHNDKGFKLDFEGITHDDNHFYLISETHFQILKISKDGKQQSWIPTTNQLEIAGTKVGLFQTHNAYFEGICLLDNNQFLLAAERQPRGFVEYDVKLDKIHAYQMNQPVFNYQDDRSPDFTGLSCDDEIYVLDRNADMVAELIKTADQFTESKGYSYQHIVNQPQLQYLDMQFGQAEGLVVKGNKVYIILDNNRSGRSQNPENKNSLFLELKK